MSLKTHVFKDTKQVWIKSLLHSASLCSGSARVMESLNYSAKSMFCCGFLCPLLEYRQVQDDVYLPLQEKFSPSQSPRYNGIIAQCNLPGTTCTPKNKIDANGELWKTAERMATVHFCFAPSWCAVSALAIIMCILRALHVSESGEALACLLRPRRGSGQLEGTSLKT